MQWTISTANPGDAAILARLHGQAFPRPWQEAAFRALLAAPGVCGLTAAPQRSERAAGVILTRAAGGEAEILTLAVEKTARLRGCGRALVKAALERLQADGAVHVFLEVASDNAAAIALYDGFSFARAGVRPGYYRMADGTVAEALILKRERLATRTAR